MSVDNLFKDVKCRTILAPMAGYTDFAFREICRRYGVGLTVTEMVSSKALVMGSELSRRMLFRLDGDSPAFCQIFGHEPEVMAESVSVDEVKQYDGIDVNMGCPVRKIVSNGDGSALLENPALASRCITAVKNAIGSKPLSVKFRLGVNDSSSAVDFTKMCRDSGADFVTVHFRTRKQMYSGAADFSLLSDIARVGLPVFANGDITTRQQYLDLTNRGAYGVAVGRGAVGRPYIFAEINGNAYEMDVYEVIERHAQSLSTVFSDRVVCNELKKHVACYLKGKRNAKSAIVACNSAHTTRQILDFVAAFLRDNPQFAKIKSS